MSFLGRVGGLAACGSWAFCVGREWSAVDREAALVGFVEAEEGADGGSFA